MGVKNAQQLGSERDLMAGHAFLPAIGAYAPLQYANRLIDDDSVLRSARVRMLHAWWKSFAPTIPHRADFDILDHLSLAPFLYLIECYDDGRYLYRLNGEEVVRLVGASTKGTIFGTDSENVHLSAMARLYARVAATRRCNQCVGNRQIEGVRPTPFESIDCPLSGERGQVSHIVGLLDVLPRPASPGRTALTTVRS